MTVQEIEIIGIAVFAAIACALPGIFLVLRQSSMMSDAISHTSFLGIVLAFFIVRDLGHPFLIIGAAIMGLVTVSLTEMVSNTRLLRQDAAIGLVFPALFSLAIILVSIYLPNVHLDQDSVLEGELLLSPFERGEFLGIDLPRALWTMGIVALLNGILLFLFYKELKVATFDSGLAASLGYNPKWIHYGLMSVTSYTAVSAFESLGIILVVAFVIIPAVTAYLLTNRLSIMILLSIIIGILGGILGYLLAVELDSSVSAAMVTVLGFLFLLVFFFSPKQGIFAIIARRSQQKWEFAETMLTIHLLNHEGKKEYDLEAHENHLQEHIHWDEPFATRVVTRSLKDELVTRTDSILYLTEQGRARAAEALIR